MGFLKNVGDRNALAQQDAQGGYASPVNRVAEEKLCACIRVMRHAPPAKRLLWTLADVPKASDSYFWRKLHPRQKMERSAANLLTALVWHEAPAWAYDLAPATWERYMALRLKSLFQHSEKFRTAYAEAMAKLP